jgi:hypothetical protein
MGVYGGEERRHDCHKYQPAARLEARATGRSFENTIGGTQRHLDFHGSRVGDRPMDTLDSRGSFSRLESRDDRDGGERW